MGLAIGPRASMITCTDPMKRLMTKVFLDTSYAVALSSHTDENHERAVGLAEELEASSTPLLRPVPFFWKSGTRCRRYVIELLR